MKHGFAYGTGSRVDPNSAMPGWKTAAPVGLPVRLRSLLVWPLILVPVLAHGQSNYYRHVVFDNSITPDRYFYSSGHAAEPSRLALDRGKLPVDTQTYFTPPNAIRLVWRSEPGGSWDALVNVPMWRNRGGVFEGDTLYFWCFSTDGVAAANLPRVQLSDADGRSSISVGLESIAEAVPAKKWIQVKVPLRLFVPASSSPFDPHRLRGVRFLQGAADGGDHTLIVDELKMDAGDLASQGLPAVPKQLRAKGYDRHIDLSWASSLPDLAERYLIYRSFDGVNYRPVGMQVSGVGRYADFIGEQNRKAYYKVRASDRAYQESNFSESAAASTQPLDDAALMTMLQEACFRYYWERAHPVAGMALENVPGDDNMVAVGASGFGIMAIVAGVDRGFITREQGARRMLTIAEFLEKADRFHGAWPHFLDGRTGKVMAVFSKYDDGADLVETAFLMEGLLAARQYFRGGSATERRLFQTVTRLWESVEWDWFRKTPDSEFLYWHWSPDYEWHINHKLIGWNETMIVYLLAIASPKHGVPASLYYTGWSGQSQDGLQYRRNWGRTTDGDHYSNGQTYYGIKLDVGVGSGGPLFFTQYSFMGFDPRGIRDRFTDYFVNNRNIALINRAYCIENPGHFPGYGADSWGLTASDGPRGYRAHEPNARLDQGTMAPTGAMSSFPYTPEESMAALKHFYRDLGDRLWDVYGFRDAFNLQEDWFAPIYMGLNQAPITVMIENYRSGLIWRMFMANPEVGAMLDRIGFMPATQSSRTPGRSPARSPRK
jgi:hypothetical protein